LKSIKNHNLKQLIISENEIHIWQIDIETQLQYLHTYWSYLSNIEQSRASKFRFEIHKNKYIVRTAVLRILLSNYMRCQPKEIEFKIGEFGKPKLNNSNLGFNLSHSKNKAIIAISKHLQLGVDIEYIDEKIEAKQIANHYFSVEDRKQLYALNDEKLADGFFNIWTKKEAFIKAIGTGLTYPLDSFDVNLDILEKNALTRLENSFAEAKEWNLFSIETFNDFKSALAYNGKTKEIQYFNYN
jgi:4'-phosphopantetheinyl transferase